MRIESIILRELEMRLKSPFETSFGVTQKRRILLVEVVADGVTGWGEVTTSEAPFYNYETTDTAWHIISDFITPRLIGKELRAAAEMESLVTRWPKRAWKMHCGISRHDRRICPCQNFWAALLRKSPAVSRWAYGKAQSSWWKKSPRRLARATSGLS